MGRVPLNPSDAFESLPLKQRGIQDANLNQSLRLFRAGALVYSIIERIYSHNALIW